MAQQRGVRTGAEVPAETLPTVPSRTWPCNFRDFMRLRAAAQSPHRSACCLPMLSPVSLPASIWYGITNFLDLTYTAFVVALSLAFNNNQGFDTSWLGIMDIIGSIIYVADLIMGFHIGVVAKWEGRAVTTGLGGTAFGPKLAAAAAALPPGHGGGGGTLRRPRAAELRP
ncbi:hypothetical protein CHLNCDRAFT_144089 [Chlorella variabilis]|uniref:Uncharacterized protein n=1 Tax=Chlorella variabilis TaxID=554065 RepID=E1ZBV6_CHLVA|nr:hypothetical protein CHLNCDRAFT_144089 [Chlorella variabilis]EFN56495.1 hypothetical protein CHLNCDRAFT_144089 [Chlorella variabilis]|eukprot:XP_005848597.1 hypothetical protein CHLNCDRAFT_144089 [Chlorella variabilis]